eukprot:3153325-Amphidinium_carterae.1
MQVIVSTTRTHGSHGVEVDRKTSRLCSMNQGQKRFHCDDAWKHCQTPRATQAARAAPATMFMASVTNGT